MTARIAILALLVALGFGFGCSGASDPVQESCDVVGSLKCDGESVMRCTASGWEQWQYCGSDPPPTGSLCRTQADGCRYEACCIAHAPTGGTQ